MFVELIEDFGGVGDVFHFAHANAYPIKTYESFLNQFVDNYSVIGMHQRPVWPDADIDSFDNWSILADDLIRIFDERKISQVIGVGHSMGAIATLIASIKRPDLFKKLVLIEPVILPLSVYGMMKGISFEQLAELNPLLKKAFIRRNEWSSKEEALEYFNGKSFFKRFSETGKKDFIEHGIKPAESGSYTLSYAREWEAKIYGTNPNPWDYLDKIKHPCLIIRAEFSDVITTTEAWTEVRNAANTATCIQMDGAGHLIPQEMPEKLYKRILEFL